MTADLPNIAANTPIKRTNQLTFLYKSNIYEFGDHKPHSSLKLRAHVLGIPSPKEDIDGSMVRQVNEHDNYLDHIILFYEKGVTNG